MRTLLCFCLLCLPNRLRGRRMGHDCAESAIKTLTSDQIFHLKALGILACWVLVGLATVWLLSGCRGRDNFELNPTAKDAKIDYGTNAPRR